jgi:hypothetical protein
MFTALREKLHALATAAKKRWLILAAVLATVAPAIPDLFDQLQTVDYSNMTMRGIATAVGLILLRTVVLRFVLAGAV